jgi:hypothetical protein
MLIDGTLALSRGNCPWPIPVLKTQAIPLIVVQVVVVHALNEGGALNEGLVGCKEVIHSGHDTLAERLDEHCKVSHVPWGVGVLAKVRQPFRKAVTSAVLPHVVDSLLTDVACILGQTTVCMLRNDLHGRDSARIDKQGAVASNCAYALSGEKLLVESSVRSVRRGTHGFAGLNACKNSDVSLDCGLRGYISSLSISDL